MNKRYDLFEILTVLSDILSTVIANEELRQGLLKEVATKLYKQEASRKESEHFHDVERFLGV